MPDIAQHSPLEDSKAYIQSAFGALCNMPLLCDHSASWEVLVSRHHIMEYTGDSDGEKIAQVPVSVELNSNELVAKRIVRRFCSASTTPSATASRCCGSSSKPSPTASLRRKTSGRTASASATSSRSTSNAVRPRRNCTAECRCASI